MVSRELAELHGTVAAVTTPEDLPGVGVQSGKERNGPVAAVVMGAPFHLTGPHWQQRTRAVQRPESGTSHPHRAPRPARVEEVQPHDVPDLIDEQRVAGQLEGLRAVGLETEGAPDPMNCGMAQSRTLRHGASAPVRRIPGSSFQRQRHHLLHLFIAHAAGCPWPRLVQQAVQAPGHKPPSPLAHRGVTDSQVFGDSDVGSIGRALENNPRSQGKGLRRLGPTRPRFW